MRMLLILIALFIPALALSGERAHPISLGFSSDGKRFAFIEWGVQDGSGFPFANVFLIDLAADEWLAAPTRVLIEDEGMPPLSALLKAIRNTESDLDEHGIGYPARLLFAGTAEPLEPGGGAGTVNLIDQPFPGGPELHVDVWLENFPLPHPGDCVFGPPTRGFQIKLHDQIVHRDERFPNSRICPAGYRLERIFSPDHMAKPPFLVALVGYEYFPSKAIPCAT